MSDFLKKVQSSLRMWEVCTLIMLVIYIVLTLVYMAYVPYPFLAVLLYLAAGGALLWAAYTDSHEKKIFTQVRRFSIIPVVYIIYSQVYLTRYISGADIDPLLIQIDRFLFGTDPTVWLHSFANPFLTEYLQFSYMLFFFLPITLCVELYRRGTLKDFDNALYYISFAFFVSYLLYFFAPAIGPRFTLHEFSELNEELPGVWLTEFFRLVINGGAGLAPDAPDPAAVVNRDCMPSGHTMITLVTMILAFKYNSRFRFVFVVIGTSLIFSTIYLRYHYVIDMIAGVACAFLTLALQEPFRRWVSSKGFSNV